MIENGELPPKDIVFFLLKNQIKDDNPKIDKYIEVLHNSINNSSEEEIFLIIRVLFVLESYKNKDTAIRNFIYRFMLLDIHLFSGEIEYFKKIIDNIDFEYMFDILRWGISQLKNENDKRLRTFFNWCLHIIWNIDRFCNHKNWSGLFDVLKELLFYLVKKNRISSVMYLEFFIYHIMGNSFQTTKEWREFNKEITQKTAPFYKKWGENLPKPNPTKKSKKRIAFIKDRVVINSIFQTEYSLFKSLKENREFNENYEIAVYSANYTEKSPDDDSAIELLKNIGVVYINPLYQFQKDGYYNDHYQKALKLRETLINDDIDIIIMGGVFPILDFLYLNRTAPMQIYYSHGNCAFDIEGIDKRISHFAQECEEFEWNIVNVILEQRFLIGTDGEKEVGNIIKQDYLRRYGENTIILGTIGRLVKIDNDEYIKTVSEIMKQNPNTIYLACGDGNQVTIKEKLKKYNIDEDRFLFLGQVKSHIYGWVIDVWPDSFPLGQGQSKDEFIAKNRPVIFHIKRGVKRNNNNKVFIAKDDSEYIEFASKLIKNKEKREEIAQLEHKLWFKNSDIKSFMKVLE